MRAPDPRRVRSVELRAKPPAAAAASQPAGEAKR
jgi:hypothetical protein